MNSGNSLTRRVLLRRSAQAIALGTLALSGLSTQSAHADSDESSKGLKPVAKDLKWAMWPVDDVNITGRFGQDYDGTPHRGLDLGPVPWGTQPIIYAPADGTVVEPLNNGGFGVAVCLDHLDTPYYSLYAHMEVSYVKTGDKVKAGTAIGKMGWTGKVDPPGKDGTHLHWQVCLSKDFPTDITKSRDPLSFPFEITTAPPPAGASLDEAAIKKLIEEVLDERKMEFNFAEAVTGRLFAIYEATKTGPEWEQLRRINWATDPRNPQFNA